MIDSKQLNRQIYSETRDRVLDQLQTNGSMELGRLVEQIQHEWACLFCLAGRNEVYVDSLSILRAVKDLEIAGQLLTEDLYGRTIVTGT